MTGSLDERERGYEAKWAHDQELHFRVLSRRDYLVGVWAAGVLGLTGPAVEEYARRVVQAGMASAGKDPVYEMIRKDFGVQAEADNKIHDKMLELFHRASDEITGQPS